MKVKYIGLPNVACMDFVMHGVVPHGVGLEPNKIYEIDDEDEVLITAIKTRADFEVVSTPVVPIAPKFEEEEEEEEEE